MVAASPVLHPDGALPFPAIVGHAEAKNALLLLAVDPLLGGVLLAAGVGSGKSSLIRSFRAVLPMLRANRGCPLHCDPDTPTRWCAECRAREVATVVLAPAPFVEVPANVTDDRILGGLDLEASLRGGIGRIAHGLLALANRGFLQVENINLLQKEVGDRLLSALGQGAIGVEREGLSRRDPAAFALIGSYDPAEGPIRPHLADRLGLIVPPPGRPTAAQRAEVVRIAERSRRDCSGLAEAFGDETALLTALILEARQILPRVTIDDQRLEALLGTADACGVEGNRADLFAVRAACAAAALDGRDYVDDADLRLAVSLVLLPRATRLPQPPEQQPSPPEPEPGPEPRERGDAGSEPAPPPPSVEALVLDALAGATLPEDVMVLAGGASRSGLIGSRGSVQSLLRGKPVGVVPGRPSEGRISVSATLRAAAPHQRARGRQPGTPPRIGLEDVRLKRFRDKAGTLFIFCVDASGSMALNRMRQAKGAVAHLLGQAYVHRDKVALVAFRAKGAEVLLPPSQGVERAKRSLDVLPTGGGTPLAAGLLAAHRLAERAVRGGVVQVMLICITDGRANVPLDERSAADPAEKRAQAKDDARLLAVRWRAAGWRAAVIDTQASFTSRGEAATLAGHLGGRYLYLPGAKGEQIAQAVVAAL